MMRDHRTQKGIVIDRRLGTDQSKASIEDSYGYREQRCIDSLGREHVSHGQDHEYDHRRDHHQCHVEHVQVVIEAAELVNHDEHHQVHDDAADHCLDCET